jgi:pyruvate/2-oxoacid:ferredoxin oxidoreductase alpha subunit
MQFNPSTQSFRSNAMPKRSCGKATYPMKHSSIDAPARKVGGAPSTRPMTGNEAFARGAWEAGVKVGAAYPGTPSTEIMENLATYPADDLSAQWSTNEKVACDVAIGASFAGVRALTAMKHVGLNVASDALMSMTYIGVNGGLVLIVCDDPGIHSSQNEQDTRYYSRLAMVPTLEPSDAQEALDFTKLAFELSERFETPVIVRSTTRLSHTRSLVDVGERLEIASKGFLENPDRNVMIPSNARTSHPRLLEREQRFEEFLKQSDLIRREPGDARVGVISLSTSYTYVKEVLPEASILKLGCSYPLPRQAIRDFAESVDRLFVVEELEPIIENEIRAMGLAVEGKAFFSRVGEFSPELVRDGFVTAGVLEPDDERPDFAVTNTEHAAPAGSVRRLPAYLNLHVAALAQCAGDGGYRLLYPGGGLPAALDRYLRIDGLQHRQCDRAGQGGRRDAADHCHHRRLDHAACRHPGADRRGLQRCEHHRHPAGQSHHSHDRRAEPRRHRQDPERRSGPPGQFRRPHHSPRREVGEAGGFL